MAYQESVISAMGDIPELVATFAAAHGWTVTGAASAPVLTRAGGGLSFQLTDSISGNDHILAVAQSGGATATANARIVSPKLNGTATPAVSVPSKVHLFADSTPEPFLAIVVEYAFNSYRHLYIGNLVKASGFTGGEVISGAQPLNSNTSFQFPTSYRTAHYLFGAFPNGVVAQANSGGVHVNHADNPTPWRRFYGTGSSFPGWFTTMDSSVALGGFCDDINDGYIARGRSPFAGVQLLSPITLYASVPITGDTLFAPLGHPAGVRHVNMADLEPGAEFAIGSQTWKVFPAFSKGPTTVAKSASGWGLAETSYDVGYAYPKN